MFAILVALIEIPVFVLIWLSKSKRKKYRDIFEAVFGNRESKPGFEISYAYGYTTFGVIFNSKDDLEESKLDGSAELFSKKIGELCKNEGSKKRPFEADQAICFTYAGKWDEMKIGSEVLLQGRKNV